MTRTYMVEGMTCNGCKASVTKNLSDLANVNSVQVDLDSGEVVIDMISDVPIAELQMALPDKFTIKQMERKNVFSQRHPTQDVHNEKTKLEQLRPLFLILLYIMVASLLLHRSSLMVGEIMLDFMGLFFVVFAFFKLLDLNGFKTSFAMYDPLAIKIPAYGRIYPFIETVLGVMFLMRLEIRIALIITIIILAITTYGVTKTLMAKKSIPCACLGTALNLPMTEATFIENAIMIIMAIFMLSQ